MSSPPPRPTTRVDRVILDSLDSMVAKLVERLDGLGNDEYLFEPVGDMWSVRATDDGATVDINPDRGIDPAPVTTIAWRLWHLAVDCFEEYTGRFSGAPATEIDAQWTLDAGEAIARLQSSYQGFRAQLESHDDWFGELGDAFGPFHRHCIADFAMHASNELVHHGAEIALLRDLYAQRLPVSLGHAIHSLRSIRRLRPDPIPDEDLETMLTAAIQAPNGANLQPWHFITVTDPELRRKFAPLYHEAWWAKRTDAGYTAETLPESYLPASRLADEIGDAPVIVLFCSTFRGEMGANMIIPAVQNMLLAGRAMGIGGTITTLHPTVERRVHELFDIPDSAQVIYAIPMGYPRGRFGPVTRRPLADVSSRDRWSRPTS